MTDNIKWFGLALIIFLPLQFLFVHCDQMDNAHRNAIEFTQAYFNFNKDKMSELLCEESLIVDENNMVDDYIYKTTAAAHKLGYGLNYMKSHLFNITTKTLSEEGDSMTVKLEADCRKSIHYPFFLIAKLFGLGKTVKVTENLKLVKEDGKWKVCGHPFALGG